MPEFILDLGLDYDRFNRLDAFTKAYVEAMFWTECNSDNEELEMATFAELSQTSLATIVAECATFQETYSELLEKAYDSESVDYDESRAGHDFWLTRNRHGAGYWDRGLGDIGRQLADAADSEGERYVYLGDDEMVHCS